jgi:hypothetical protein
MTKTEEAERRLVILEKKNLVHARNYAVAIRRKQWRGNGQPARRQMLSCSLRCTTSADPWPGLTEAELASMIQAGRPRRSARLFNTHPVYSGCHAPSVRSPKQAARHPAQVRLAAPSRGRRRHRPTVARRTDGNSPAAGGFEAERTVGVLEARGAGRCCQHPRRARRDADRQPPRSTHPAPALAIAGPASAASATENAAPSANFAIMTSLSVYLLLFGDS